MENPRIVQNLLNNGLAVAITTFIGYYFATGLYNLYFSPLAKYPGPFFSKISAVPSFYYTITGNRHLWIWQCHQRYGTIFRFHPNGVLIDSPSAYRAIYGGKSNIKKSKFYEAWPRNPENKNTLNGVDPNVHARKRRVLNSAFTELSLRSAEAFITKHTTRWCELIVEGAKDWSEPKNISDLANYLFFDIMGDLSFGRSFEIKEEKENPNRDFPKLICGYVKFMYAVGRSPIIDTWVWLKPRGLDNLLARIAPQSARYFWNFTDSCLAGRIKMEEETKSLGAEGVTRTDLFHYLFNARDPETGKAYSLNELKAEASLLIIAGSDTSSVTLSAFFFYITRAPEKYEKLVSEIRDTFKTVDEIKGGTKLSSCVYLRACIEESLRLSPPVPADLPREALPGGATIDGEFFPGGTQLGCSIWALHYNKSFHHDAMSFYPERWLVGGGNTPADVSRTQSAFFPFSFGPGNCAGQRLAYLELLLVISRVMFLMNVRVAPKDRTGEGSQMEWGMEKNVFEIRELYVAQRDGPMVQFSKR